MRSNKLFYASLFALAAAILLLGGCAAAGGAWISIPRNPCDVAADIISGGGSSVYIRENGYFNPLRKQTKAVADSIATITTEEVVLFPGQGMQFAVAPGRIPKGMKIASIRYMVDQNNHWRHVDIEADHGGGPGSRFCIENKGDGYHVLTVRVVFTDCLTEDLNVINDVHVPLFAAPTKRAALNAKYGWG
ncbi:MAG: hypothetical protein WC734_02175 [Patescibacteria group bacterium]|jgi:hypothetical protein